MGGGTGGHITPLLAVAHELKKSSTKPRVAYVIEKGSKFSALVDNSSDIDEIFRVSAGKFRRYHGESFVSHLLDVKTLALNFRDLILACEGFIESLLLLRKERPDVIFFKGGYVGLPVGLAAALLGIPYITHDSDTVAGLANKVISRWAVTHATGMPAEFYTQSNVEYVGIPLSKQYSSASRMQNISYREDLGLPAKALYLVVTGGSQGAERLNNAFASVAEGLLKDFPNLYIFHQTGEKSQDVYKNLPESLRMRVLVKPFVDDLYRHFGAADLIITRAGATTVAEIGAMGKACLLIPGAHLTGGQQIKNAHHLEKAHAAAVTSEQIASNKDKFGRIISGLLRDSKQRAVYAKNLNAMIKKDAAKEIAEMIKEVGKGN